MNKDIADLRIYTLAEDIDDEVWWEVMQWKQSPKNTVGVQLVKAVDSIGANIAEGYGRYHYKEDIHFLYYAGGSCRESNYWLQRAFKRALILEEKCNTLNARLQSLLPQISAYINSIKNRC